MNIKILKHWRFMRTYVLYLGFANPASVLCVLIDDAEFLPFCSYVFCWSVSIQRFVSCALFILVAWSCYEKCGACVSDHEELHFLSSDVCGVLPSCGLCHWLVLWIYMTSHVRLLRSNILHLFILLVCAVDIIFMYLP